MTTEELITWIDNVGNRLVPVAGELMRRACMDMDIHEPDCDCNTCRCFVTVQAIITETSNIMREHKNGS